jgi:hypothetical protein
MYTLFIVLMCTLSFDSTSSSWNTAAHLYHCEPHHLHRFQLRDCPIISIHSHWCRSYHSSTTCHRPWDTTHQLWPPQTHQLSQQDRHSHVRWSRYWPQIGHDIHSIPHTELQQTTITWRDGLSFGGWHVRGRLRMTMISLYASLVFLSAIFLMTLSNVRWPY